MSSNADDGVVENEEYEKSADAHTAALRIGNMCFSAWLRSIVSRCIFTNSFSRFLKRCEAQIKVIFFIFQDFGAVYKSELLNFFLTDFCIFLNPRTYLIYNLSTYLPMYRIGFHF